MSPYFAEAIGTLILILLGDGVVANVVLNKSKGNNSGWIVITAGWGLAVALAVYAVGWISGAHLNPAVTLGMAVIGKLQWSFVPGYIVAQMVGAFLGTVLVWLTYLPHWKATYRTPTRRSGTSPLYRGTKDQTERPSPSADLYAVYRPNVLKRAISWPCAPGLTAKI